MKILAAVHNFPPHFTGGVERVAEVLALSLVEEGHEVQVFAGTQETSEQPSLTEEEHRGLRVHRWRSGAAYTNVVDTHDPACSARWEKLLHSERPDVVHIHHWYGLTTDLVAVAARLGIPAVVTLHDFWTTCALFFRMPDDIEFCREEERVEACLPCVAKKHDMDRVEMNFSFRMRFAQLLQEMRFASAILVSSAQHAQEIARVGRFPEKVFTRMRILPMGAAPVERVPKQAREDDRIVVAHWGNVSPLKGTSLLVQAAARSKFAERLSVEIYGECLTEGFEASLVDAAGAARVTVHGRYDPRDLPGLLAGADLAAFPSLAMETHSLVLDEALQLGLPVIVSDRGALPERVGGRGVVVPAGDLGALTEALDRLVDADERAALAAAEAGNLVDERQYARRVADVYEEVSSHPPRRPAADLVRDRLAFRNGRLAEIGRFVGQVTAERDLVVRAVEGDAEAQAMLREQAPDLAARLDRIDKESK